MAEGSGAGEKEFSVDSIREANWRQGACLEPQTISQLVADGALPDHGEEALWVVLTQDCDLYHRNLDNEPVVELISAQRRAKKPKSKASLKDPRELHVADENLESTLVFRSCNRVWLPRELLCELEPSDISLTGETRGELIRWVARKYTRVAFPDAFVDRVRPAEKDWAKAERNSDGDIYAVYVNVTDQELTDEPYRILVVCIASPKALEDDAIYQATQELTGQLGELLTQCDGIELVDIELRSQAEFSIEDQLSFQRWDFDASTIAGDGIEAAPIDP